MGLFDRIPANFKPGAIFQLGRGAKLVPAGAGPSDGSPLQYQASSGNWIPGQPLPLPFAITEGDMLYAHLGAWVSLAAPASPNFVIQSRTVGAAINPGWASAVSPTVVGLTTNGDMLVRLAGVVDRLPIGANKTVLMSDGSAPGWSTQAWTAVGYTAGDFTASGGQTWTVDSGDLSAFSYVLLGRTMTVAWSIDTSSVSGACQVLSIKIPASKTANKLIRNACWIGDNSVFQMGLCQVAASGTVIQILRADLGNFAASTNTTYAYGQITFETTT